ncbi:M23 family metallopeptidase [Hellea balneolensis]|uniref:M23 family metallopeptidase n=1 Tax=Hellea balneolensis TaxID=287478 RepID=UPI0004215F46|nr:M23 family metallopeptidase [Hellea balneolensis]
MINDVFGELRSRVLQHFPERQLYLRSGGEVKYYVFGTKTQMAITGGLMLVAAWCVFTMFNLIWGYNPMRAPAQEIKRVEARYQRLLADAQAKESNARLMLSEQRQSFEQMAKSFEEKHNTISQILKTPTSPSLPSGDTSYADDRILMAPTIRDAAPRSARTAIVETASANTGMDIDRSLSNLDITQNAILASAEIDTLNRIERGRAIIRATDLSVDTVLSESPFGKGGLFVDLGDDLNAAAAEGDFGSRVASIKARVAEAEALDNALTSLPFGHPVGVPTYRTSSYGLRKDPFTKRPTFHQGLDFGGRRETPIVAAADGTVIFAGRNGGYGRSVEIDHGHGFVTRYGHMHKLNVKRGQVIKKGDKIGGMGSTGRSTATHLHYEVHFQGREYDPDKFLKAGHYVQ